MSSATYKIDGLKKALQKQAPFSLLAPDQLNFLFEYSKIVKYPIGETIVRPDQFSERIYIVISGEVRYLYAPIEYNNTRTLDKRGRGQLLGWVSLLRSDPTEWVTASTDVLVLAFKADQFVSLIKTSEKFSDYFENLTSIHESFKVADLYQSKIANFGDESRKNLFDKCSSSKVISVGTGELSGLIEPQDFANYKWFLSTVGVPNLQAGYLLNETDFLEECPDFHLKYRLVGFPDRNNLIKTSSIPTLQSIAESPEEFSGIRAEDLGILDPKPQSDLQAYPLIKANNLLDSSVAVFEMICQYHNVPFRKEAVYRILEDHNRKNKKLSLELFGGIYELLGFSCQLGTIKESYISSLETPALFLDEDCPLVIYNSSPKEIIVGNPRSGILKMSHEDLKLKSTDGFIKFLIPKKTIHTPDKAFGFSWFYPLIRKYKKSLLLVFLASLLSQLFGLAIPLIIQQIIDKVLAQGNLSSLNVLGTLMICLAFFQGILSVLRTYIFVDTTDRIDLTLGSAVINRLLTLPLKFFEKRPVGELSQRLGELNTIRSFLTGTALTSAMSLIFALLYLVVMLIYSPLLTAVALSTIPIYILLVIVVAPIYKSLIRNRAVQQARTQSHIIEVLGGIQTVKAQHFEKTARWKWQDRYSNFVNEGFKAVAVGSSAGEIGKFLNQLSGLLVLWVGMWLVLEGQLTLGMLIAFRIIASNVTSPLLQLSSLYQGYQGVQLSIERLSDIIDNPAELSGEDDLKQIGLPPISGKIKFEDISFRFGKKGPYQVDNVSFTVNTGEFVGIVGQSGSGKSTLMKLLPRLYSPDKGRIFIDDYDIAKVNLSSLRRQVGIVPQDSLLFEGTIAENIALNDPQAETDEIIAAAKLACAHDFIMALPKGYATALSEKGSNLSGGQRQRIAIARTVLSNPNLLILDEATSALDYNTEKQLCCNLQAWAKNKTVLFITHRLATIKNSDQIFLMDQGRLVEKGTHDELIGLNERYSALYKQQGQ